MILLLFLSLAPIILLGLFIYFKDKYEKEPLKMLIWAFFLGAFSVIPILFVEIYLGNYWESKFSATSSQMTSAAYDAFVVAAFTEELFKFAMFMFFIWRNKNFNEKFDGIVYAVFISLGFACVENIMYVFQNGMPTGILRAFTAVPAHALFGISMGYCLGIAKFKQAGKTIVILCGLLVPLILHGFYDFILMSQNTILLLFFVPFIIFMIILGLKKMKEHSQDSAFKNGLENINENNNNTLT